MTTMKSTLLCLSLIGYISLPETIGQASTTPPTTTSPASSSSSVAPPTVAPVLPGNPDKGCRDEYHNCWDQPDENCQGIYEPWARDHCAYRCGYCPEKPACVDEIRYCHQYDPAVCTDVHFLGWARKNCRKMCKMCVDNSTTLAVTNDVTITASPDDVIPGLVDSLTVSCLLPRTAQSQFSSVISLIIAKSPNISGKTFDEIASLTNTGDAGKDHVIVKNSSLGGQATGQIVQGGDASISFTIQEPTNAAQGVYRCEAFGVDSVGHPRTSRATVTVREKPVTFSAVVSKIKEIRHEQDAKITKLQTDNSAQKTQIDEVQKENVALKTEIGVHQHGINLTALVPFFRLQSFRAVVLWHQVFTAESSLYSGSTYILSHSIVDNNFTFAMDVCRQVGGRLAELSTLEEYNFAVSFIDGHVTDGNYHTYIGSRCNSEDKWQFASSVTTMDMTEFSTLAGDKVCKADQQCLAIWSKAAQMENHPCSYSGARFLCEISFDSVSTMHVLD